MSTQVVSTDNPFQGRPASGRSSWLGEILLGPIHVPVKAFTAAVQSAGSSLHLVHAGCGKRLQLSKTCSIHGTVEAAAIARAYEYAPDDEIVVSDEELSQLRPVDDHRLRIDHLVPSNSIELALLAGRTLHLIPAHAAASASYAQVTHFLGQGDLWGIGTVTFSEHRQLVAVRASAGRLVLQVFHWPAALRAVPTAEVPQVAPTRGEIIRLEKLLAEFYKPFAWDEYSDDYDERLAKLVSEKVQARALVAKNTVSRKFKTRIPDEVPKPRRARAA